MKLLKLLLFTSFNLFLTSAIGQWSPNTALNTSVAVIAKTQQNTHSVTDAKNGVIIGWDDNRNNTTGSTDIYAQRLNSDGIAKWLTNGVAVCTNTATQRSVAIIEDGNGGAILTWEDNRSGNYDIYAQKIDSNGNPVWSVDGVIISNGLTNQKNPKLINDNSGGAIIVWEDSVNFYFDIYAQRVNSAGAVAWTTNGVAICTSLNTQNNPKIDINGSGGAIITWQDKRNNTDYDIYAQNINPTGTILWAPNGVAVCLAANTQNNPRIEPDGASGAVIAWTDKRNGLDYDIYAQRLDGLGAAQWTANGIPVCVSTNNQSALDIKYLGSSGVALSWKDQRSGSYDIYAQIISLAGINSMAANGLKISNSIRSLNPNNIADGAGGVIVAWQDSTALGFDIVSQKINSAGILQWTAGGVTVSNASSDQINVSQVTDGFGGAIFIWEDHRNTSDYDVFAQHVNSNGLVGINELKKAVANVNFFPNPTSGTFRIKLNREIIPRLLEVSVYSSVGTLIIKENFRNTDLINLTLNEIQPSGIYYYTIFDNERTESYNGTFIFEK